VAAATRKKIPVANLPGSNTRAVVEYCLAVIFYFRRRLDQINEKLRHDGWNKTRPIADSLTEIETSTIGIVGVGAIGSKISKIAFDLGMDVIGFTRRPDSIPKGIKPVSKAELFKQSDIVIISCSLNDETRGMVDKTMIDLMKPTAILINIARGPIVDSAAIVTALKEGRLGGAAMDVHDHHPLEGSELVFNAPNLLLTPHIASITATSLQKMSEGSVDTLLKILQGQRPTNIVNPEVFSN
jgi:D-3-phosphoglycerate dehydrogenase